LSKTVVANRHVQDYEVLVEGEVSEVKWVIRVIGHYGLIGGNGLVVKVWYPKKQHWKLKNG
jgi:hypothetical protein